MFKAARWKSDKNKITAVFKFQFHATQVSEFGGNGLMLSLVPAENGKPTAKLEKCSLRESNCYWENPVYETVKFVQDLKSGKIHERIYYFIVSIGSPKGSLVGEFSVNIADYIDVTKACSISFPFKKSVSNSHLHVSIQRIQEGSNQRHIEENEGKIITLEVEDKSLRQHFNEEGVKTNSNGEEPLRSTISHLPGLSGAHRGSSGSDITLSSSDSSSVLNSPGGLGVRNTNANRDMASNGTSYQDQQRTRWDLAIVPVNGLSSEFSPNSPIDVFSIDRSQMGFDDSVEKLKADLVVFSRRGEVSELELQTLRKQIVKESKKGQDLLREITCVKEERDALKDECKKLKTSRQFADNLKVKRGNFQSDEDQWSLAEEIREELNYEKDLNADLRLQLQKTQESNAELLLAVQDLEKLSNKNNRSPLPNRLSYCSSDDEEQMALEEVVKQQSDANETYILEQKVMDLCSELEMYRRDKDELEIQMEQLALDYEILKQENHEFYTKLEQNHLQVQMKTQYESSSSYAVIAELEAQRDKLQNELNEQSRELSHCLATTKELEARTEELEKQVEECKADKESVARSQLEQEQRAARADEALDQSGVTINELEAEIQKLTNELKKLLQELSGCFSTIHELETHRLNFEDELEKQGQEFQADMEALTHAKMEQEKRALEAEKAVVQSNATINDLDSYIKKLENELKMHSEESFSTMADFKELEAHIQNLEDELEKQAEVFEADLEEVTLAKVEQEKRAIQAEEALRLVKLKNADTAARIQDEFKRLSSEMRSSFKANEELASKALVEAGELRLQNRHLQDTLQKANEELQSARHDYESKMQDFSGQINIKATQLDQMVVEFKEKSKQFENQIMHMDELQEYVRFQHSELSGELDRLNSENANLAQQAKDGENLKAELEQMKALLTERDIFIPEENMKIDNLDGTAALIEENVGASFRERNETSHQKDEKEQVARNLSSEVETLTAQCDNLKHSLYEDELEKENLRKQVFQLKADLKKKDEVISSIEKKSKENNGRVLDQDKSRTTSKCMKSESLQHGSKEIGAKEVATLKEKVKLLEGHIKSKEAAFETSANAFRAKERNLYGKIEELENQLGDVKQSCPGSNQDQETVSVGMQSDNMIEEVTSAGDIPEASVASESSNDTDSQARGISDGQHMTFDENSGEPEKFDILLKEMVLLKENNNSMEVELKEMQERYSEISLKFAEVEGERQKLMMKLRNIKNTKKS